MPKHKNKDKDFKYNEREKKIAKYERRLARYKHLPDSMDSRAETPDTDPEIDVMEETQDLDHEDSNMNETLQFKDHNLKDQASPERNNDTGVSNNDIGVAQDSQEELDSEFLSALGESGNGTKQYGEAIHKEIYGTINKILLDGMKKQQKEKVCETLLIPSNCKLLDAPKLNIQFLSVLSDPSKNRDKLLEERQQDLGIAIGSICEITNTLSKKDYNKFDVIKKLTDVSRLLCNSHFQYTEIRRRLVKPYLDKQLMELLKDNKRDECLYSDFDSLVKSHSAMKRAANVIKPKVVSGGHSKVNPKNTQQPPRRLNPNQAHPGRGSYRGASHQRYNPRPQYKPQEKKPMPPSTRGRAKYP